MAKFTICNFFFPHFVLYSKKGKTPEERIIALKNLIQKHPYLSFSAIMLVFVLLKVLLTPLLTFVADEGLAITVPLAYFTQALAYIPPFLAIGITLCRRTVVPFPEALLYFAIFAGAELIGQFPLSYLAYTESISSPFWLYLLLYLGRSLVNSLFFLLLILLGYLLFVRKLPLAEKRFWGLGGSDAKGLLLSVLVIASQDVILFIIDFIEYLDEKLFLLDGIDLLEGLYSLLFIALCALLAFCAGRFGARIFGAAPSKNTESD